MSSKLGKVIADFQTSLATEIAVGGTTATLQSATDDDGVALPAGVYFFTLDVNNSQKEHIVATLSGTSLTSIKSVSRQGAQTVGVARKHRVGASVEITDFAHLKYINDLLDGTTYLNASTPLRYDGTATINNDNQLATKAYVDGVAVAGAPDASVTVKGIVEIATGAELAAGTGTGGTGAVIVPAGDSFKNSSAGAGDANKVPVLNASGVLAQSFLDAARTWGAVQSFTADNAQITSDADSANDAVRQSYLFAIENQNRGTGVAGETLAVGDWVYLKAADSKLWKTDADADESTYSVVGVIVSGGAADATVYFVRPGGIITGLSGLTAGSYYFLSGTAAAIAVTPHATRPAKVAQALSTTSLRVVEPRFVRRGTTTITGTGNTTITTGFYPVVVRVSACGASNTTGYSYGDDTNNCSQVRLSGTNNISIAVNTKAWSLYNANTPALNNEGSIDTKTQTGFNFNCSTSNVNAVLQWEAEG